jgi:hypothetical protein
MGANYDIAVPAIQQTTTNDSQHMSTQTTKAAIEAIEQIANALSPNNLPIEAEMENVHSALAVRRVADECFDLARTALEALRSAPQHTEVQPVAWFERWIPPPGESHPPSMTKWNLVEPKYAGQTLQSRIDELRSYSSDGRAQHEVRPLFAHPPGTLTVEQAMECVMEWKSSAANDCYPDPDELREALTAKARG